MIQPSNHPHRSPHRLVDLVRALTGCSRERAELAVSDSLPAGPISLDDGMHTVATALVVLRGALQN
ncbi:MAG: hypothetical protein EXQ71_02630 [Acidimicrobiia bacterium]|nr:hypothetical protein [Acidimicrobiia bacterium]